MKNILRNFLSLVLQILSKTTDAVCTGDKVIATQHSCYGKPLPVFKKIIFKNLPVIIAVLFCYSVQGQPNIIDYNRIQNKEKIELTVNDSTLTIVNIISGQGKQLKMLVTGKSHDGKLSTEGETETVVFDLKKIFKGKKKDATGNFMIGEEALSEYLYKIATDTVAAAPKPVLNYTGIAYWDALNIFSFVQAADYNKTDLLNYINNYAVTDYTSLDDCKNNNEFFKTAFEQFAPGKRPETNVDMAKISRINDTLLQLQSSSSGGGLLGSLSGLDVTQYVQAFADFLRDRIKEELTIAYINDLRNKISSIPEFAYMLPKTINVFNTGDVFNLPSMGPTYKTAFAEDMASLPENFERMVFSLDKYKNLREREDFILFMAAYYSVKMSAEKYHPADILRFIDSKYGYKSSAAVAVNKVRVIISLLDVLSKNLKNVEDGKWIDKSKLGVLHPFVINVFLGLIYEQNRELLNVKLNTGNTEALLKELLSTEPVEKIFQFIILANNIEERITEIRNMELPSLKEKADAVIASFVNNADDLLALLDYGLTVISANVKDSNFYRYKEIAKNAIAVAKAVKTNNVAQVSVNVVALIKQITGKTNEDTLIQQLTYYTNFITDMVYADSSKKIKEVLQNYAMPPRSYRVIRQSSSTVSFAALPGLYAAYETNTHAANDDKGRAVFGITAPIGVAVGWGNSTKESSSLALFLSLVDIGAALTYRFNNDTADLPQKVLLGQIFSPGLFGVYGLKNSPLAIKLGAQYMPELRSIKNGANTIEANAWHFSLGVSVDIPIFVFSRRK